MALAMFYHLTRSSPEETLPPLIGRAVGQGWRVMVRGTDPARLSRLDDLLWQQPEDGFLPHGTEGAGNEALQPVLIGRGPAVNAARGLFLIDGAVASLEEAAAMERLWVLFDGGDPALLAHARDQWRSLTAAGIPAQYWSEEGGRWEKRAEHPSPAPKG
jgi:DNA polymerase-3 subunit chi